MKITREGEVFLPHDPCRDRVENILALIHGDLSTPEEKVLLAHVEHCPGCASFLELNELVDDEFHSYFTARKIIVPNEIPKKVRIQLALTRKKNLAMWLHELGRAIFFQQPKAADSLHPGKQPYKFDKCFIAVENVCASALEDPFLNAADLSIDFVNDCRVFIKNLKKGDGKIFNLESTKEVFDRSLEIDPESVPAIKSLSDYFRITRDFPAEVRELKRATRLVRSVEEKRNLDGRLGMALELMDDLQASFQFIESARRIRYDFRIDFLNFRNYLKLKDVYQARMNLESMDKKIETEILSDLDVISVDLISKWFVKDIKSVSAQMSHDFNIVRIMEKYMGRVDEK